jgi:hypothetical protein
VKTQYAIFNSVLKTGAQSWQTENSLKVMVSLQAHRIIKIEELVILSFEETIADFWRTA